MKKNKAQSKPFRIKIQQPSEYQRTLIKKRCYEIGLSQTEIGKQLDESVHNVHQAFRGNNAKLMNEIESLYKQSQKN